MVAIPESPRLPKLLSATTIALVVALLFALLGAKSRHPDPPTATISRAVCEAK